LKIAPESARSPEYSAGSAIAPPEGECETTPDSSPLADLSRPFEPSDAELEAAIVRAMLDGRGAVADELTRQLRARREAAAGNVVSMQTTRRGGR
jgi:hypothetical protein